MRAIKANKVYQIDETQKKSYQDMGYDIQDDNGKVVAYGRGKTVPYGDYMAVKEENDKLKTMVAELKAAAVEPTEPENKTGKK